MLDIRYLIELAINARAFYSYSHWYVHSVDRNLVRPTYRQSYDYLLKHLEREELDVTSLRSLLDLIIEGKRFTHSYVLEDTLYLLLVLRIGHAIEINRRHLLEQRVYSYRLDFQQPNLFVDFSKYPIGSFKERVKKLEELGVQLTSETVQLDDMNDHLFDILYGLEGINQKYVKDLERLYEHWDHEFPTESLATRLLEEAYMIPLDDELVEKRIEFIRYGRLRYIL